MSESEIYYWKDKYLTLKEEYDKLQELYQKQGWELDKANYKIQKELEPRLAAERRQYDRWVTNQGIPYQRQLDIKLYLIYNQITVKIKKEIYVDEKG